jgi:ABC-2 type transport system ATP-binding protein
LRLSETGLSGYILHMTLIAARSVTKRFGTTTAVDDLSVAIADGEMVALLGPNGAGKTTLIRMIVGLIRPDEGTIERAFASGSLRPRGILGYLPEERGLYQDMPVHATLSYFGMMQGLARRTAGEAASMWLERLGLVERGNEKVKSLSKGNQQKVQFAAAILHRPRLAILDEPFSGLDPVNQEIFLELIRELRTGGTTVIFSAHQMTLVERLADRVCLMSRGRLVLQGSIAELRRTWHTGERLLVGLETPADTAFLHTLDAVEAVERHADREISIRLRAGASLSELLGAMSTRMEVKYIRSEETTLHEIYLRTVEADLTTSLPATPEHP